MEEYNKKRNVDVEAFLLAVVEFSVAVGVELEVKMPIGLDE